MFGEYQPEIRDSRASTEVSDEVGRCRLKPVITRPLRYATGNSVSDQSLRHRRTKRRLNVCHSIRSELRTVEVTDIRHGQNAVGAKVRLAGIPLITKLTSLQRVGSMVSIVPGRKQ